MSSDPSYWLDHFDGDEQLAALVVGGMTRRRCPWCERELRPCRSGGTSTRSTSPQTTIDEILDSDLHAGSGGKRAGPASKIGEVLRVLRGAARRRLALRRDRAACERVAASAGTHAHAADRGADETTSLVEHEIVPVARRVE